MQCMPSEKHRCRETMQRIKTLNPDWKLGWKSDGLGGYVAKIHITSGWLITGNGQTLFAALNRANLKAIEITKPLLFQPTHEFNRAIG